MLTKRNCQASLLMMMMMMSWASSIVHMGFLVSISPALAVLTTTSPTPIPVVPPVSPPVTLAPGSTMSPTTAPKGNEICDGALTIAVGQSLNGSNINPDASSIICSNGNYNGGSYIGGNFTRGLWYKFLGTGGPLLIDTCQYQDYVPELAVFVGNSCESLTCLGANYNYCGDGAGLELNATIQGETYFVFVYGLVGGSGSFTLTLSEVLPPSNSLCSNATLIQSGESVNGVNTFATIAHVPFCGLDNANISTPGVWFRIQSSNSSSPTRIIANTCGLQNNYDTAISVFSGSCDQLVCVAGNDNYCGLQSRVAWEATPATDYLVLVHGIPSYLYESDEFILQVEEHPWSPTVSPAPSSIFIPAPYSSPLPPLPVPVATPTSQQPLPTIASLHPTIPNSVVGPAETKTPFYETHPPSPQPAPSIYVPTVSGSQRQPHYANKFMKSNKLRKRETAGAKTKIGKQGGPKENGKGGKDGKL